MKKMDEPKVRLKELPKGKVTREMLRGAKKAKEKNRSNYINV